MVKIISSPNIHMCHNWPSQCIKGIKCNWIFAEIVYLLYETCLPLLYQYCKLGLDLFLYHHHLKLITLLYLLQHALLKKIPRIKILNRNLRITCLFANPFLLLGLNFEVLVWFLYYSYFVFSLAKQNQSLYRCLKRCHIYIRHKLLCYVIWCCLLVFSNINFIPQHCNIQFNFHATLSSVFLFSHRRNYFFMNYLFSLFSFFYNNIYQT